MADRVPENPPSFLRKQESSDFMPAEAKTLDSRLRGNDGQKQTLRGRIRVKHGYPFKSEHFTDKGKYIVLTPGNFLEEGGFKQQAGKEKFYDADFPGEYLHKRGDLIVAMTEQAAGLLGSMAFVPESDRYLHNQRIGKVTPIGDDVDLDFLYYAFRMRSVRTQLSNTASGSKVRHTSPERIYDVSLPLPPVADQKRIAAVLSALDAKIDLNNRINAELEALAKTIYDYWFVQFDFPDAHGRPYRSSGGAMVWNDTLKREIPAGWEDDTLWNIAKYTNGLAMQKFRPKGDDYLPVIKIKEMSDGFTPDTERASPSIPSRCVVDDGDILFSWSATLAVQIWAHGRGALNQHIFKVTSKTYPKSFVYFELLNYLGHFKMMAEKRKTTMGHITLDHLRQSLVVIPPLPLIERLDEVLRPLFDQSLGLSKQNQELTRLRDWLLPLLMNGQVRVAGGAPQAGNSAGVTKSV